MYTLGRFISAFILCLVAPLILGQQLDLTAREARYVVILKRGANPLDVRTFGGRIESTTLGSMTVVIPTGAEKQLQQLPGVASIQPTVAGNRDQTPDEVVHKSRIATDSFKAAPLSLTTLWNSGTYGYDNLGNITSVGPNHNSASSTFTYDASSRLKTASVASSLSGVSARTETYDYDGFGNITTRAVTSSPTVTYSPSADLSTNRMTSTGISYDIAGNLKTETGKAMNYDSFNMLASLDTSNFNARYIYTPNDERIAVQSNGSTQWTLRDTDNKPMRQLQSPLLTASNWSGSAWSWVEDYVWNGGQLVAGERPGSGNTTVRRHFHLDHLGSPRLITDNNRSTISLHDYSPFGEEITSVRQEASCCGREEPINFTGHERDFDPTRTVDNDDYYDYMHARMYSSAVGRFLATDPLLNIKGALARPQTWNRYSYVGNQPVSFVDSTGRDRALVYGEEMDVNPGDIIVLHKKTNKGHGVHVVMVGGFTQVKGSKLPHAQVWEVAPATKVTIDDKGIREAGQHKPALVDSNDPNAGGGIWSVTTSEPMGKLSNLRQEVPFAAGTRPFTTSEVFAAWDSMGLVQYDNQALPHPTGENGQRPGLRCDCASGVDGALQTLGGTLSGNDRNNLPMNVVQWGNLVSWGPLGVW